MMDLPPELEAKARELARIVSRTDADVFSAAMTCFTDAMLAALQHNEQRIACYQASRDYAIDILANALGVESDKVRAVEYYATQAAAALQHVPPREPTDSMEQAASDAESANSSEKMLSYRDIWRAMYDAAPHQPSADAQDAARYRWLSDPQNAEEAEPISRLWGKHMDAAIDAAIAAEKGAADASLSDQRLNRPTS